MKQNLNEIERLLKNYRPALADAADTIRTENVSNYPIFVASKTDIEVGVSLFQRGQMPQDWRINASTLEEFHVRRLIETEKIDSFRELYRSHKEDLCVFVLLPNTEAEGVEARFIFIPF